MGTIILMMSLVFCMSIVGYAAGSKKVYGFYNYHIQSGYISSMYDSFKPTDGDIDVYLDVNSILSTGDFEIGIARPIYIGTTSVLEADSQTVSVTSTSQDLDGIYSFGVGTGFEYKAYMIGYNGVHFIVTKGIVYYD